MKSDYITNRPAPNMLLVVKYML